MAAFDPLDSLISLNVESARRAAYAALCLGALTLVVFVYWMIQIPWQVTAVSPALVAEGGRCGMSGATASSSGRARHHGFSSSRRAGHR